MALIILVAGRSRVRRKQMRIKRKILKSIPRVQFIVTTCIVLVLIITPHVCGQVSTKDDDKSKTQGPLNLRGIVEFGGQVREIQGGHPAKFEEVRDVPKGFFVQKMTLDFLSADSPYSLSVRGFELRERDQRFTVEGGRVGKFRTQFVWDQVPHHFGSGQSFLQETEPGLYQVSPTLRALLQALTTPEARIA